MGSTRESGGKRGPAARETGDATGRAAASLRHRPPARSPARVWANRAGGNAEQHSCAGGQPGTSPDGDTGSDVGSQQSFPAPFLTPDPREQPRRPGQKQRNGVGGPRDRMQSGHKRTEILTRRQGKTPKSFLMRSARGPRVRPARCALCGRRVQTRRAHETEGSRGPRGAGRGWGVTATNTRFLSGVVRMFWN